MKRHRMYWIMGGMLSVCFFLGAYLQTKVDRPITQIMISEAGRVIGLEFSVAQRDSMIDGLKDQRTSYERIRKVDLPNSVPPALLFNPIPAGMKLPTQKRPFVLSRIAKVDLPKSDSAIAFLSLRDLAELVRTKKISSVALTKLYLERLKRYDPALHCVVTLTEEIAMKQAARADKEIAAGKYRGPLHGIPFGVKDLLATKGIRTTWGSVPFKEQIIDEDATVIKRLENAGAVLVAKLTMGELAEGDVWFGGLTRSPWDTSKGSSGSSAGPASATAAGLVGFSIGTETWGSIVSPSTACGTTGLRPTYGRVSRTGAMALSWSMDKIGPICRTADDCAIVFNAIQGLDGKDQTLYDVPFNYNPAIDIKHLRIGFLANDFDSVKENRGNIDTTMMVLRSLGAKLMPVSLPNKLPTNDLSIILTAEAAAAFDDLTRSGNDDMLVRQTKDAWPNTFRVSRFIPAVEYIQANRIRYLLVQQMQDMFKDIDCYVAPSFAGDNLLLTNLTGHPCVVVPNGFTDKGMPTTICFMGKLFDEATVLALAKQYQDATRYHKMHPRLPG